jgi:hypothetical protein
MEIIHAQSDEHLMAVRRLFLEYADSLGFDFCFRGFPEPMPHPPDGFSWRSGHSSIWSMGIERDDGRRKRVLTVEVAADRKTICQVGGKANRMPTAKEMETLRRWAAQEGLTVADHVRSR